MSNYLCKERVVGNQVRISIFKTNIHKARVSLLSTHYFLYLMAHNLSKPTEVTQEHLPKDSMVAPPQLPLIDFSELDGPRHNEVVASIIKAAEGCGFIQVVNHGLSLEYLDELKYSVYGFHNQPKEKKEIYVENVSPSPLVRYRARWEEETLDHLVMFYTNKDDALKYWPECCREMTLKHITTSNKLAEKVMEILLSNLGVTLDESTADAYMGEKFVLMNYYPARALDDITTPGTLRHTDLGTLTVLLQDHVGGLFGLLGEDGDMANNYKAEWVEIKPIPGALIIFLGDCLQILSNGRYKGSLHYVKSPAGGVTRVSFPAFTMPKPTTMVGPLAQAVEKYGGKPLYKEFVFGEYRAHASALMNTEIRPIKSVEISY